MDIFKFFFHHDLPLEAREEGQDPEHLTLEDFMKPLPTYSRFYLTGTRLDEEQFGLDQIDHFRQVVDAVYKGLENREIYSMEGTFDSLGEALQAVEIGSPLWILPDEADPGHDPSSLRWNSDEHAGAVRKPLVDALKAGWIVMYKDRAKTGFDLQLYSRDNIYDQLFVPLKKLAGTDGFRVFSINSKRIQSERKYYFETWTLDRPPHGAEEIFPQTAK